MSLAGSWPRRRPSWWFTTRSVDARLRGGRRISARSVARDFGLWERELTVCAPRPGDTLTTVIGGQVVEVTVGLRPIQEVAGHLRRLRAVIDGLPPDVSFVRWEGIMRAYDDYLFAACHELGVPTDLVTIGFGRQRDEERLRLERLLHEAGLPVR